MKEMNEPCSYISLSLFFSVQPAQNIFISIMLLAILLISISIVSVFDFKAILNVKICWLWVCSLMYKNGGFNFLPDLG